MIEGVRIESLNIFPNEKGDVLHMMRCDSPLYKQFGEIYFSFVKPGAIKGWKKHVKQTQHFAVPVGQIKLVLYDDRPNSQTSSEIQEIVIGESKYCLVRIPPQIWYSFEAISNDRAMIANCTDVPHDPDESVYADIFDEMFPYAWGLVKK